MQMYYIITLVLTVFLYFTTSSMIPTPTDKDMMFYVPKTDDAHALASGDYIKTRKEAYGHSYFESILTNFFMDSVFLIIVTVISSLSIGFAHNIKSQGERSDGNKVKVEYMKKHLIFVNNFNYLWILFLANSYFMMAYFMD